jgi:hypothetical protein
MPRRAATDATGGEKGGHTLQLKAPLEPSGSEAGALWRREGLPLLDLSDAAALGLGEHRAAPQNSFPACAPVLARRSTITLPQRGHVGRACRAGRWRHRRHATPPYNALTHPECRAIAAARPVRAAPGGCLTPGNGYGNLLWPGGGRSSAGFPIPTSLAAAAGLFSFEVNGGLPVHTPGKSVGCARRALGT